MGAARAPKGRDEIMSVRLERRGAGRPSQTKNVSDIKSLTGKTPFNPPHFRILDRLVKGLDQGIVMQKRNLIDIDTLDFLRGVAAVYVLINHARGAFFIGGEKLVAEMGRSGLNLFDYACLALLQLTSLGQEFVIVFFVISGYAMANSVASSSSVSVFYLKRILRIWPPYLLACAMAASLCLIIPGFSDRLSFLSLFALISYLNVKIPFAPQFWSLPYEVLFYAICPFALATRERTRVIFLVSCVAAAIGVYVSGLGSFQTEGLLANFLSQAMLFFSIGAFFYYYGSAPRLTPKIFVLAVVFLLAVVLLLKLKLGSNILGNVIMAGATCLVIANLPAYGAQLRRFNLGKFSYSIYIFHYQILSVISYVLLRFFGVVPSGLHGYFWWTLVVPPVLAGCWALYLISERPCNLLLKRIRGGEWGAQRAVAATSAPALVSD